MGGVGATAAKALVGAEARDVAASSSAWKVGPLSPLRGGGEGAGGTASAKDAESIDGCLLPTLLAAAEAD